MFKCISRAVSHWVRKPRALDIRVAKSPTQPCPHPVRARPRGTGSRNSEGRTQLGRGVELSPAVPSSKVDGAPASCCALCRTEAGLHEAPRRVAPNAPCRAQRLLYALFQDQRPL